MDHESIIAGSSAGLPPAISPGPIAWVTTWRRSHLVGHHPYRQVPSGGSSPISAGPIAVTGHRSWSIHHNHHSPGPICLVVEGPYPVPSPGVRPYHLPFLEVVHHQKLHQHFHLLRQMLPLDSYHYL